MPVQCHCNAAGFKTEERGRYCNINLLAVARLSHECAEETADGSEFSDTFCSISLRSNVLGRLMEAPVMVCGIVMEV